MCFRIEERRQKLSVEMEELPKTKHQKRRHDASRTRPHHPHAQASRQPVFALLLPFIITFSKINLIFSTTRWSLIAGRLPGRTDNEVKNYWNTHLNKKSSSRKQNATESVEATPWVDKPVMSTEVRGSHGGGEGEEDTTTTWMEETNFFARIESPQPLTAHYPDTLCFDPSFAFTDCFPLL